MGIAHAPYIFGLKPRSFTKKQENEVYTGRPCGFRQDSSVRTVVHEWGHIAAGLTEKGAFDGNLFGNKLKTWYHDNATGQPKAGVSYGVASGDTFRDLPIKVPSWYSAKTGGRELESTFFEYLFLNPAKLVREYPDFVKLVLGMMK